MGYESKIYVVDKTKSKGIHSDKFFADNVASFRMGRFPPFLSIFTKPTDCFVYADDGNTEIVKDNYGDTLKEASLKEIIECLEKEDITSYRKIKPLLDMLKGFNEEEWSNLIVLHYGY